MSVLADPNILGHFDDPPIAEVVCGVKFKPLPGLDPIVLGAYWKERADDFPGHQVQEALHDANELVWAVTPLVRFWFISPDGEFLLQVQHDRFFLNWRRVREGAYPRFNDRAGQSGVFSRMLLEFQRFSDFCERMTGARPVPTRCELSKIDHFLEPKHWNGLNDLATMLPWLETFAAFSSTGSPGITVQFSEPRDGGNLVVSLRTPVLVEGAAGRVVLLDTRVLRNVSPDARLAEVFATANAEVNTVFGRLIPDPQRYRFNKRESAT